MLLVALSVVEMLSVWFSLIRMFGGVAIWHSVLLHWRLESEFAGRPPDSALEEQFTIAETRMVSLPATIKPLLVLLDDSAKLLQSADTKERKHVSR